MKKLIISLIAITIMCVSISLIINLMNIFKNAKSNEATYNEAPKIPNISQSEIAENNDNYEEKNTPPLSLTYIVKAYNGKVCVFERGKDQPFKITDCIVNDLPPCDREVLEKGIEAKDEKELNRILEDYCG